jgi:hypothetical protein
MSRPQTRRNQSLKIHPAPFKPTHLSVPPSPFSPRTPLTPLAPPKTTSRALPTPDPRAVPQSPLQWLWQCHQCHRTYALGVTRRCLEDGHMFCAGSTTVKNWRKSVNPRRVKKHKACSSQFDYEGWKRWGTWRRSGSFDADESDSSSSSTTTSSDESCGSRSHPNVFGRREEPMKKSKDCWNTCNYPSECRWGKQFGVPTPVSVVFPTIPVNPSPPTATATTEDIPQTRSVEATKTEQTDFWGALIASATRRKSVSPSSPLATVPGEVKLESKSEKDKDGDVVMAAPETCVETRQSPVADNFPAVTAPVISLKEMMKLTSKRRCSPKSTELREGDSNMCIPVESTKVGMNCGAEMEGILDAEFPPLERVKSYDSGYYSTISR